MLQGLIGKNPEGLRLLISLAIVFVPAAALGAAFDKKIEDSLFGPWPIVAAWIVGGALILYLDRFHGIGRGDPSGRCRSGGEDDLAVRHQPSSSTHHRRGAVHRAVARHQPLSATTPAPCWSGSP